MWIDNLFEISILCGSDKYPEYTKPSQNLIYLNKTNPYEFDGTKTSEMACTAEEKDHALLYMHLNDFEIHASTKRWT